MEIFLLDINKNMTDAWSREFNHCPLVHIVNDEFTNFMKTHPYIDSVVSPANSFGIMSGGFDKGIISFYGPRLQINVFTLIDAMFNGYQPIGTTLVVPFGTISLIHCPTMRTPESIIDDRIIFDCAYNSFITALKYKMRYVVVPAFGGCTGKVPCEIVAKYMKLAYKEAINKVSKCDWYYAKYLKNELNSIREKSLKYGLNAGPLTCHAENSKGEQL